jgi:hypothetical protein
MSSQSMETPKSSLKEAAAAKKPEQKEEMISSSSKLSGKSSISNHNVA